VNDLIQVLLRLVEVLLLLKELQDRRNLSELVLGLKLAEKVCIDALVLLVLYGLNQLE
jgi:hypothetical protein